MRLRGYFTMLAGLLLAVLAAHHAGRLRHLGRQETARDEARGLTEALRWRLELNRAMLDLNDASMGRALGEIGRWPDHLEWAGLYRPNQQPASKQPLAAAGAPSWSPSNDDFQKLAAAGPEELPLLRSAPDGRFLALTRLTIGQRELALAMRLAPEGPRPGTEGVWSAFVGCLMALAAAALFLVWQGTADVLSARRAGTRP